MFSGIVQGLGTVQRVTQHINVKTFYIAFDNCAKCSVGDSVAINGTCLTVTSFNLEHTIASFDAVPETLQRTTLDDLLVGDTVNTETAIRYGDVVGGHMMQGHIDEKGFVRNLYDVGGAWIIEISASSEFLNYLVPKGFVSIDGMSITVVDVLETSFTVTLIPHTMDITIANQYKNKTPINLEADATGKYIYKYVKGLKNV